MTKMTPEERQQRRRERRKQLRKEGGPEQTGRSGTITAKEMAQQESALRDLATRLGNLRERMEEHGIESITFDGQTQFRRGYKLCTRAANQYQRNLDDQVAMSF
jgi:hypothetical protein